MMLVFILAQMALEFMQEQERLDKRRHQQHAEKIKFLQEAAEKDINTFKSTGIITSKSPCYFTIRLCGSLPLIFI